MLHETLCFQNCGGADWMPWAGKKEKEDSPAGESHETFPQKSTITCSSSVPWHKRATREVLHEMDFQLPSIVLRTP
eukprot:jgi/Botrbrau1/10047/Bobra.0355s0006.1